MTSRLDLNADLGEHTGAPPASALALLQVITSASIACGGHAGDATSMRLTVTAAAALGVQIGAHPSYPDREGFGRRVLPMPARDVADAVAGQVRALCDVAAAVAARVEHVKPHGALYNVACRDREIAAAVVAGILRVDTALALYAPHASALWHAGAEQGMRLVAEGFLDRAYEDDGTLASRDTPGALLDDPEAAQRRAIEWALSGRVATRSGQGLALPVETLCVHGDTPGAIAIARRVREGLEAAGVRVRPALAGA